MKIYRSKRDKKLYVLSINKSLSYLGECLEYMLYYDYPNGK